MPSRFADVLISSRYSSIKFDGIKAKLVNETALKLAKGRKVTANHRAEARKIVLDAFERMWREKIAQSPAFDHV